MNNDLIKEFTAGFKSEARVTRLFLERVPLEKRDFKPHEKSETLGVLAIHVAEVIAWWEEVIANDELDFIDFKQKDIGSTNELLDYFDHLYEKSLTILEKSNDDVLSDNWSMRYGDLVYFTLPKRQVLQTFCMNHLVHHRAQLGVYLRMLDIPVPATYGPSADDEDVLLIDPFEKR